MNSAGCNCVSVATACALATNCAGSLSTTVLNAFTSVCVGGHQTLGAPGGGSTTGSTTGRP